MSTMAPSQSRQNLVAKLAQYALHAVLCAFFIFPLLFMFVSAFKTDEAQLLRDMNSLAAFLPQGELSLGNFIEVFNGSSFVRAFFNSLFTVSVTVVLGILVNSMLAYALAR
ncbi:MAG: carbohydrate ABC transporter permease, partial [Aquincola tertiaricarbonis]